MKDFGRGGGGPRRSYSDRGSFGGGSQDRPSFKAVCADCGRDCDLPFEPRGNRPVYCRDCFKNHSEDSGPARFGSRDSRGEDRGGFRGNSRREGADRPMFSAVCDNCGKTCQLPFEPRSGKEVFCSNCFEQKEKGAPLPRRNEPQNNRGSQNSGQLDAINTKLDKILNLLSNGKALKLETKDSKEVKAKVAELVKDLKQPQKMETEPEVIEKVAKPKKKIAKKDVKIVEPIEPAAETPTE